MESNVINKSFQIGFEWLSRDYGDALERATFAELAIHVDGQVATKVEDLMAKTVRSTIRASAYTLALWFAANWWRLRWEPEANSASWKMSHKVGAAGGGYVWPDLALSTDGSTVLAHCRPTNGVAEPIRFLSNFDVVIPAHAFERGVDEFIEGVIARFENQGHRDTDLTAMWSEIREERGDPALTSWRKLEAMLDCDPDEAPGELIEGLKGQAEIVGEGAIEEMAAAAKFNALEHLYALNREVRSAALIALPDYDSLRGQIMEEIALSQVPWQQAAQVAHMARNQWHLNPGPIRNETLSDRFGIPKHAISEPGMHASVPMAAGYRENGGSGEVRVFLNRRYPTGLRFALARLVADHLRAGLEDRLLPATEARTARQKFQRAFAQEFLCPFEDLTQYLGTEDPTDENIEDAAAYFEVSPLLVKALLVNRGVLDRIVLPE
jgi:hypothetical protein